MDWMKEVAGRLRRKNQVLFSKDSPYLEDLALLLRGQDRRAAVLWALELAAESVAALEARYPGERRPREALEAFGRYENLVGQIPHQNRKTGYFLHLEQAKLLACRKQYGQALEVCRQLREDFCTEPFGEQRHFSVELDLLRAEILLRQGEVPGAMELARSCTEVTQAMRGEAAKETLSCQEVLADAWAAAGEAEAARTLYRQILHKLTQYYPRQTQWYETLREKEAAL